MAQRIDLTGRTFGRLLVLRYAGTRQRQAQWYCRCDCGRYATITGSHLRAGQQSCGCAIRTNKRTMPRKMQQQLRALYEGGATLNECCDALGYNAPAYLANVLRRMGVQIRPNAPRTAVPLADLQAAYAELGSYRLVADRFALPYVNVKNRLIHARRRAIRHEEARNA